MTHLEQTFLWTAITEVLPDLPEIMKDILEETLNSLGWRHLVIFSLSCSFFCVCFFAGQTPETSSSSVAASPGPPASLQSLSPRSSPSTSSNSCKSLGIDWMDTFIVLWDKLPEELMQSLEREKRPSPRMRREMFRIVVCEMTRKSSCFSRRNTSHDAKKVAKYPKSLQDIIGVEVIGPGYHSLVKQLQNRIENVKRCTSPKVRKRKQRTDESDRRNPSGTESNNPGHLWVR